MEHGKKFEICYYKYLASTEHGWNSEEIYKYFVPTEHWFRLYFLSNYINITQLRRSLILVTTIITVFKACRRYAIFVILNPQNLYLNRFFFCYGALTYSIYYPNFLFEIPRFFAIPNNELIKPVSSAFSADEAACCNFINAAETVRFLISFDEIP